MDHLPTWLGASTSRSPPSATRVYLPVDASVGVGVGVGVGTIEARLPAYP